MKTLETMRLLLGLLPVITEAVQSIEAVLPAGGQGAAKLALVRDVLRAAYGAGTDAVAKFEELWPIIAQMVSAVVAFYNSTGLFRKS